MRRDDPIVHVMTAAPRTVRPEQTIAEIEEILGEGIHHLPVVEEGRLIGLVSSADLMRLRPHDRSRATPDDQRVIDVMEPTPITIGSEATVMDAARMLATGGFHSLPVVDRGGRLAGIVTSTDLIQYLLAHFPGRYAKNEARGETPAAAPAEPHGDDLFDCLQAVLRAAERYLHSGMGEREHSDLVRAVRRARDAEHVARGTERVSFGLE